MRARRFGSLVLAAALVAGSRSPARGDDPPASATPPPAAAPMAAAPAVPEPAGELDLAQIVTSAAKGVTTVQEAPAIITIITAEEIRQRGWRHIQQVLSSIPGWLDTMAEGNQVTLPLVRGAGQAVLILRDGVSFFDPTFNLAALNRGVPLEAIKRVEVVTGPGGVLWGANSYLGIVNLITKDGEDVSGVEASVGYGDGPGSPSDVRAYAMFGRRFWKDRLKVMIHTSYESYEGPRFTLRRYLIGSPTPQPVGPAVFGAGADAFATTDVARSWIYNFDGKISLGPVTLMWSVPFGEQNASTTFARLLVEKDAGADGSRCPACERSTWNVLDRYVVLEYRDRFFRDKLGVDAKAYYINFDRALSLRVYHSTPVLPGGLTLTYSGALLQRFGGTLDVDYSGPWSWNRLVGGFEAFYEGATGGGPGGGLQGTFPQPTAENLPIVCPRDPDDPTRLLPGCPVPFLFGGAERTVVGLFVADQIRPVRTLTLDGGVRYQQGFGRLGYTPQLLGSAAAVWQFLPDLHLKANFSQGFRPPVFNNLLGNGASVQFAGNPKLAVERSASYSAELNARLLRNRRTVRELQLRLDYAYTLLDNIIVVRNGGYQNSGRRAIHSVEFLSKLYLAGDHALQLTYTFQQISSSDNGEFKSVPRHYFQIGAFFNLVRGLLDVNGNLTVWGGADDPNRYPSSPYTLPGNIPGLRARVSDSGFDRLPPVAQLQLGARLRLWKERFSLSAQFFNVLNQQYAYPDVFFDLTPIIEIMPNPAPGWSFFASATFRYGL